MKFGGVKFGGVWARYVAVGCVAMGGGLVSGSGSGSAAGAASSTHHASQPLTKTAHAPFGTCPAGDITLRVSLPRLVFTRGQSVAVQAVVTNAGTVPCNYSGLGAAPATPGGIGPCGAMAMRIDNAKGIDIWPGNAVYHCPMEVSQKLAPGALVTASGGWDQQLNAPLGRFAPRGAYRLVVDGRISFTITLRSGSTPTVSTTTTTLSISPPATSSGPIRLIPI